MARDNRLARRGRQIEPTVVMSFWLFMFGWLVVVASLLQREDHHHGAGVGAMAITAAWLGAVIVHAVLDHKTARHLQDSSPRASTYWAFAVWGLPVIVFILACLAGFPGGTALVPAAVIFFAALSLECFVAYGYAQESVPDQQVSGPLPED